MPDRRTLLLTVRRCWPSPAIRLLCRAAKDTAIDAVSFTALRLFSAPSCSPSCCICAGARHPRARRLARGGGAVRLRGRVLLRLRAAGRRHRRAAAVRRGCRSPCCWPACCAANGWADRRCSVSCWPWAACCSCCSRSQRAAAGRCPADAPVRPRLGLIPCSAAAAAIRWRSAPATSSEPAPSPPCCSWHSTGSCGWTALGLAYALLSGALASGLGYAVWYSALPGLTAIQGASVQLSVPVLAASAAPCCSASRSPAIAAGDPGGARRDRPDPRPRLGRAARERLNQTEASRSSKWQSAVFSSSAAPACASGYGQAREPAA